MNSSPARPARKSGNPTIIIITAVAVVVGFMGAGVMLVGGGSIGLGGRKTTDVGGLQELAAVQTQLLPLDACDIQYGVRAGVLPHRSTGSRKFAYVTPCGESSVSYVSISVPPELQAANVAFDMQRSSVSAPWKILVEKDSVAFPELKQSLEQLAPLILAQYPVELQNAVGQRDQWEREAQERRDAERARKEAAKNSYPE